MRVTLKLATSLDGRIATATGESRWITGEEARRAVHALRADHDAVLVGVETALADDPELTVRIPGHSAPQPARVVLDSRLRLPEGCKLARTARQTPTYVLTTAPSNNRLTDVGVKVLQVKPVGERVDLHAAMDALAAEGIGSVFVEGGGQVAASFIRCGLVNAIEWFRAPIMLGGEGRPALGSLAVAELSQAPRFRRIALEAMAEDLWERYERV